jgi:hypothetical protein
MSLIYFEGLPTPIPAVEATLFGRGCTAAFVNAFIATAEFADEKWWKKLEEDTGCQWKTVGDHDVCIGHDGTIHSDGPWKGKSVDHMVTDLKSGGAMSERDSSKWHLAARALEGAAHVASAISNPVGYALGMVIRHATAKSREYARQERAAMEKKYGRTQTALIMASGHLSQAVINTVVNASTGGVGATGLSLARHAGVSVAGHVGGNAARVMLAAFAHIPGLNKIMHLPGYLAVWGVNWAAGTPMSAEKTVKQPNVKDAIAKGEKIKAERAKNAAPAKPSAPVARRMSDREVHDYHRDQMAHHVEQAADAQNYGHSLHKLMQKLHGHLDESYDKVHGNEESSGIVPYKGHKDVKSASEEMAHHRSQIEKKVAELDDHVMKGDHAKAAAVHGEIMDHVKKMKESAQKLADVAGNRAGLAKKHLKAEIKDHSRAVSDHKDSVEKMTKSGDHPASVKEEYRQRQKDLVDKTKKLREAGDHVRSAAAYADLIKNHPHHAKFSARSDKKYPVLSPAKIKKLGQKFGKDLLAHFVKQLLKHPDVWEKVAHEAKRHTDKKAAKKK